MFVPYTASTSPIFSLSTLCTKQILYPYDVLIHTNIGTSCIEAALGTGPQPGKKKNIIDVDIKDKDKDRCT